MFLAASFYPGGKFHIQVENFMTVWNFYICVAIFPPVRKLYFLWGKFQTQVENFRPGLKISHPFEKIPRTCVEIFVPRKLHTRSLKFTHRVPT
jgi:hypothetical protein